MKIRHAAKAQEHRFTFAHCLRLSGALEEAKQAHREVLKTWPGFHKSYFDLGQIYRKQGLLEMARSAFSEAVMLQPSNPSYARNLGRMSQAIAT